MGSSIDSYLFIGSSSIDSKFKGAKVRNYRGAPLNGINSDVKKFY